MPNEPLLLRKELDAQRHAYAIKLPQRISQLERTWARVEQEPSDSGAVEELLRLVHDLAGSSAIFGFRSLSEAAQTLERSLDHRASWTPAHQRLHVHLETLIRFAERADCDGAILAE